MSITKPAKDYLNSLSSEMILVEKGEFTMGDDSRISFSKDFYIGKYLVTQGLWKAVMKENPSHFKGDNRPVESIKRPFLLQNFLPKLKELTGEKYRLPTEAEWEFVASGGKNGNRKLKFSGSNHLKEVGWYKINSLAETKPVGLKKSNELGIYDLNGNVWEYCQDEWHNHLMNMPKNGGYRIHTRRTGYIPVIRGGSWKGDAKELLVTSRKRGTDLSGNSDVGFRLAKDID